MKYIFRKAWDRFLQYPLLGLPILLAAIVTQSLSLLHRSVTHRLVVWGMQTRSVLGPTLVLGKPPAWLLPLSALIGFLITYAGAIVETLGTLITASLAYRWLKLRQGDIQPKISWSRSTGGIFGFSLLALLLARLMAALLLFAYLRLGKTPDYSTPLLSYLEYGQILLSGLATAYLITPYLLRMIARALGQDQVQPESERLARYAAMWMAVIATVITFAITQVVLKVPISHVPPLLVGCRRVLIEAFPQVLLAIVFGLLLADSNSTNVPAPVESVLPTP